MRIGDDVLITKSDEQDQELAAYEGRVVHRDHRGMVVECTWSLGRGVDVGPFVLLPGDRLFEYYYHDAWFNVFKVCDGAGRLKGWYCNVTMPAEIDQACIRWRDLKLDYIVGGDGQTLVADEDEFEVMNPSEEMRRRANEALKTMRRWASLGQGPFSREGC